MARKSVDQLSAAAVLQGLLQWDRAFDGAEMRASKALWGFLPLLQWDRAFDGAEI